MVLDIEGVLEDFDKEAHNSIVNALRTLKVTGFFAAAVEHNKHSVLNGFHQDARTLTDQILAIQDSNKLLLTLQDAADSLEERKV